MPSRRQLLIVVGSSVLVEPLRSFAQSQAKVWRIGVLAGGTPASSRHLIDVFFKAMAEQGYEQGRNVRYELRYGEGSTDRMDRLARDLVAAKVDLIWTTATSTALAAKRATTSIPIVFATVIDPLSTGLVRSLAAPGTNATGLTLMVDENSDKRFEILNELNPKIRRIGLLHDPSDPASAGQIPGISKAARILGKELTITEVRTREEIAAALSRLRESRTEALYIVSAVFSFTHREYLISEAVKSRWIIVSSYREYTEGGALFSYGADLADNCRRSAVYVDKILKGATPAALPVQQPIKFEFVINLKAAKAIGLTIPRAVLLRADQLIE